MAGSGRRVAAPTRGGAAGTPYSAGVSEREPSTSPTEFENPEVPEADALEQRTDAVQPEPDEEPEAEPDVEADPADVAEQSRSVDLDDDEYR